MVDTRQLLDAIKTRYDLPSDYALARQLGVSKQCVSNWRHGHTMDDSSALRVARLLDIPPGDVLVYLRAQRSTDPRLRRAWLELAKRLAR